MLDYGFAGWEVAHLSPKEPLGELKVAGGVADTVVLECDAENVLLKKGQSSKIREEIYLPEYVLAPVSAGEALGRVDYVSEDGVVASAAVKAAETVERVGFGGVFFNIIKKMLLTE